MRPELFLSCLMMGPLLGTHGAELAKSHSCSVVPVAWIDVKWALSFSLSPV